MQINNKKEWEFYFNWKKPTASQCPNIIVTLTIQTIKSNIYIKTPQELALLYQINARLSYKFQEQVSVKYDYTSLQREETFLSAKISIQMPD